MALTRIDVTRQDGAISPADATLLDHVLPCYDYGGSARVVIRAERTAGGDVKIGAGIRQDARRCSRSSDRGVGREGGVSGAPPRAAWRSGAIVGVKLIHSAIFLLNSAAILYIFVAGVGGNASRWTRSALVVAFMEVAVFVANRGRCPLTDLVERLGAEQGRVSDIFLPRWFADRIPQLCGPLLLIGVLALLWRRASQPAYAHPGIGAQEADSTVTRRLSVQSYHSR
jgi:hypothetical protein